MADQEQGSIKQEYNNATVGLNMDQSPNQIKKGSLTYALNAALENFDANAINYQNEEGNEFCLQFPIGYVLIGEHYIQEKDKHIFFITNPATGDSQIGFMEHNDCVYHTLIEGTCLNFSIEHPIHNAVHRITNCTTEIYWTDGINPRRYLDIDNSPQILKSGASFCNPSYTDQLDCNQLKLEPNFDIPSLIVTDVISGGNLLAGMYQFAIQYSDSIASPYTSYYSITNPVPIADPEITSVNFNYPVGKSIVVDVSNLDSTGQFQYFNLAVIKTINGIASAELVGTYFIDDSTKTITYTGQGVANIRLSMADVMEKFPYYDVAEGVTTAQDILIWNGVKESERVSYQKIANTITLQWETWRLPAAKDGQYQDEENVVNFRSYLRDEIYPFELVLQLKNGQETDGFHIPGRVKDINELYPDVLPSNNDYISDPSLGAIPYWKVYNTASVLGTDPAYNNIDPAYKGPYQYGKFAYWESAEEYPCNVEMWGELAGQKIRHHKFPDVLVSPIMESKIFTNSAGMVMGNDAIFPIGVRVDVSQISSIIANSDLTAEQKDRIVGFKIVRGDRSTNKSIVAKGILRNVGQYTRDDQEYYYPNYPYNDLHADPFLTETNNAYLQECKVYSITPTSLATAPDGSMYIDVQYTDCNKGKTTLVDPRHTTLDPFEICSSTRPVILYPSVGVVSLANYEEWIVTCTTALNGAIIGYEDPILGYTTVTLCGTLDTCLSSATIFVVIGTNGPQQVGGDGDFVSQFVTVHTSSSNCGTTSPLPALTDQYRQIFNSPETSFGQPFLGNILKLESVVYGRGKAHFTQVKDNARYRLLTETAQQQALDLANAIGNQTTDFDMAAMFSAYQGYLQIYLNGLTRRNFAYSFNSIADYNYSADISNDQGIKQRRLDIARYLIPGVQNVGDFYNINNYQRESSVYLRTELATPALPLPSNTPSINPGGTPLVTDYSRFTISGSGNCATPGKDNKIDVISYYASIKNEIINQWGQLYSYKTIDTGFQRSINATGYATVFGGDTFIGRFTFKTKVPFFIDNRVNAPDDSDIFYDELGNIAYPKYWHSARSIQKDYMSNGGLLTNIISYKAHNFDCPNDAIAEPILVPVNPIPGTTTTTTTTTTTSTTTTMVAGVVSDSNVLMYYDGYFYLFAYGIPNFYCESSYNLDLRQAFNNREGDFFPHVSTGIPDDWVQENFVSIAQDNTYYYNITYSKQNTENLFTHFPFDWDFECNTHYPFRAIYSDPQSKSADSSVNTWLIYRANSFYDFPQNFGPLTSLDGIENRAVLARFENKTLLYNSLMTIDTSNPQAAYVGNPNLFANPPIDFAETDLGYIGCQNKMILKIPQGQVIADAKRGQIFLLSSQQAVDLSGFGSGMNRFFTDHLAFEILRYFPDLDTDNHFNGIGLHGVYDSKYDRVIITKLDYIPHPEYKDKIKYDAETNEFYLEEEIEIPNTTTTTSTTSTSTTTTTSTSTSTSTTTTVIPLVFFSVNIDANFGESVPDEVLMKFDTPTQDEKDSFELRMGDSNTFPYNEFDNGVDIVGYEYLSPGIYTLDFYGDVLLIDKVNILQFWNCGIVDNILDISLFMNLTDYLAIAEYSSPNNNLIESIVFPSILGNLTYMDVEFLDNLTALSLPAWQTHPDLYFSNLPMVSSFTLSPNSIFDSLYIGDCPLITTLDLSDLTIDRIGVSAQLGIYNCIGLTSCILPAIPMVGVQVLISIEANPNIGYIDFTIYNGQILTTTEITLYLNDNSFSGAIINHLLVDFDNMVPNGMTPLYMTINIAGNNAAPDNSSGGYDGIAAKNSLIVKGVNVNTS